MILLSANGRKSMSIMGCEWFSVRTGICGLYVQCKPQMTVKASAEAALSVPPLGERNTFDRSSADVKSNIALLLTKVTKPNRA